MKIELIALGDVTVSDVQYHRDDPFCVEDPATARWLLDRKAAKSASLVEAGTVAKVAVVPETQSNDTGTPNDQANQESGAPSIASKPHAPARRKR